MAISLASQAFFRPKILFLIPLLPSIIVGLSSKPLDQQCVRDAQSIIGEGASSVEEALAICTAESLTQRLISPTTLSTSLTDTVPDVTVSLPPHQHASWSNYLRSSGSFGLKPDVRFGYDLGLQVLPEDLHWFLQRIFRAPPIPWRAFGLLGERGLWLSLKHPTFQRKLAYLSKDILPKGEKQRINFIAYHHANLSYSEKSNQVLRSIFASAKLNKVDFGILSRLLSANKLRQSIAVPRLTTLLTKQGNKISDREHQKLEAILTGSTEDIPQVALPARLSDAELLVELSHSIIATQNSWQAFQLLEMATLSDNQLIRRHPVLVGLLAILSAADYATIMDTLPDRYKRGWKEPIVSQALDVSAHPLGTLRSGEWIENILRGYTPPTESRPLANLWKLNADAIEYAHVYEHGDPAKRIALLTLLEAKHQLLTA